MTQQTFDRDFLVNAFLARLAVYRKKAGEAVERDQKGCGARDYPAWDHFEQTQKAIEYLAEELGIIEDIKSAGYEEVL